MKHILTTFFDHDRKADVIPDRQWIDIRFDIFHKYTLQSILNQPHDDFEIWVFCGQKFKDYTKTLPWDKHVRLIYDAGRERISEIEDEWLTVSRIDSDDLYHNTTLALIKQYAEKIKDPKRVKAFIFRKNLMWNQIYGFIGYHLRMCQPPPFITRVYPKPLYKDWKHFESTILISHGHQMRTRLKPILLNDEWKFCIVKHGTNTNQFKRGVDPVTYTQEVIEAKKVDGGIKTDDPERMVAILAEYGISRELVMSDPKWIFKDGQMQENIQGNGYITDACFHA